MKAQVLLPVRGVGRILEWPGGYAMTIGGNRYGNGVVCCCDGHKTTEDAKNHGLVRVMEIAQAAADRDIALWAERSEAAS